MLRKGQIQGLFAIQRKCVDLIGNQSSFKEYKNPNTTTIDYPRAM